MDTNKQPTHLRFLSVCSGMEAASVAWEPLGWKAVGFSEIEPFPCAVLAHHFPNTPNYGSLTEHHKWPLATGDVDLLCGGTPCQSYSVAGKRQGLNDPRGQLMLSFLDLAQRLKVRWLVWENVPGVLSSGQPRGADFATFLQGLVERGYGWAYRVLDAQYVGGDGFGPVPQRRRRVFVVACLGSWESAAKVLFEPDCLRGDTPKGRKKGQGVATGVEGGAGAEGRQWPADTACTLNASFGEKQGLEDQHALGGGSLFVMSSGQANAAISEDKAHTLNATHETQTIVQHQPIVIDRAAFNQGQNAQFDPHIAESDVMDSLVARGPHAVGVRDEQPTPIQDGRDIDKKQNGLGVGQPGDPAYTLDTTGAQAAAIPFHKSKRAQSTTDDESWVEASESNTLNNFDLGDTRTTHAVVEPKLYENHPNDSRVTGPHDVSPTVVSRFGTGGGNVPLVNPQPIAFQPGNLVRKAGADPSTESFPTPTKDSGDQSPHVAHPCVPLDGMNLLSRLGQCGENHSMQNFVEGEPSFTLKKGGNQHGVLTPMAVRRLTPEECEALQGFPKGWTRIPWKGKPADQCPDGPRYKACGNSMATNCMRWIGERIALVESLSNPNQNNQ